MGYQLYALQDDFCIISLNSQKQPLLVILAERMLSTPPGLKYPLSPSLLGQLTKTSLRLYHLMLLYNFG